MDAKTTLTLPAEDLSLLIDYFREPIIDFIEENWKTEYAEKMNRKEAATYLGHSVKSMTKEEIQTEISDIQHEYYTAGSPCGADDTELIRMFISILKTM